MGKGSQRRPHQISNEELDLRWDYALGKITLFEFQQRLDELRKQSKIKRNGRIVK